MGQQAVYKLLTKSKKPLTINEIAERLHATKSTTFKSCHTLLKWDEIKFKMVMKPRKDGSNGKVKERAFYVK